MRLKITTRIMMLENPLMVINPRNERTRRRRRTAATKRKNPGRMPVNQTRKRKRRRSKRVIG
jgi:hypothetical protein